MAASCASAFTSRIAPAPQLYLSGGTVRLRFSGTVNATTEYADWDDMTVTGWRSATTIVSNTTTLTSVSTTSVPGDGTWYFNLRTVDAAGNWATAKNFGPIQIDTVKPTTTCSAPSTWTSATVNATLTATDPSGPVATTRYQLDASPTATYNATITVSAEGTHTLQFWSIDSAGNVESTKTATIRVDKTKPSTPTSVAASAMSTTSIDVAWTASADSVSGVVYYAVYRSGSLVATTAATDYLDTGLSAGSNYPYYVIAYDRAGNPSTASATVTGTTPVAAIWMSMSTDVVNMGSVTPGQASLISNATTVKVGGIGAVTYDFWCNATNFSNVATSSTTPTMPVSTLSYSTNGWATIASRAFTLAQNLVDTAAGTTGVWEHDYRFDYVLSVPWANDPGTYTTTVTYTVVQR